MNGVSLLKRYLALCVALLGLSCASQDLAGTDTGNPYVALSIIGLQPSGQAAFAKYAQTQTVSITEARLVLSEIQFKSECGDGEEEASEIDFEGPYVVDLLNNQSIPSLSETKIPSGAYCKLELKLDRLEEDEVPSGIDNSDPIVGHALRIVGVVGSTPFVVTLDEDDRFKIENATSVFEISTQDPVARFLVVFDLGQWFEGINWDNATLDGGTLYIDEERNTTLREQIVSNIKTSSSLYEDRDDDGELDDDEGGDDNKLGEGEDEAD